MAASDNAAGGPERIIDAWIQHPTPGFFDDPLFDAVRRWIGVEEVPQELPLELTLAMLEASGVEKALLTAWWGPKGPMISNDAVADMVARSKGRLVGVGSVNLHRPMDAIYELRRCIKELGFVALRMLPWLWGLPPNDRRYYPLYAECVALQIPFCLQVGHTGPMCPSEPGGPIPYLDEVAHEFPELTIVACHTGYPWTDELLTLARKYENLYIDTSAYKPSRYPPQLVSYMRGSGQRKVMFASDFPLIQPLDCIAQLDSLGLDEEARSLFLHGNAERVFEL
jgi:uncharacterized protein